MNSLEALMALLFVLAAAAMLVNIIPVLESHGLNDLQQVLDAHGRGRSTGDNEARGYVRWWDCAEDKCI